MSKVFVLGSTGIIGKAVALKFAREGYTVRGLVRSEEKAKELSRNEVPREKYASDADIIIEAVSDLANHSTAGEVLKTIKKIVEKDKSKTVIYTSGVWVLGSSETLVNENHVNPPKLVSARPAHEKDYLDFGGIVIRPGVVYGRSGSLTASLFSFQGEKATVAGDGKNHWTMVHTDDLANAYYLAAQKAGSIRGQVFNVTSYNVPLSSVAEAAAKASGFKGKIEYVGAADPFTECLALNQHVDNTKAKNVLGWTPKQPSFQDAADRYYLAFKAQ